MAHTRRTVLRLAAGLGAGATAGCLGTVEPSGTGGDGTDDGNRTLAASFFVVGDFASNVAGDAATVETLVPFGQHGHGWEPGPDVQRRVFDSDAFVYVGEGFQPWADDIVRNVRADDADVSVIEAWRDVELLSAPHTGEGAHGEDSHSGDDQSHEAGTDGGHEEDSDHGDGHGDSDHGARDPHFWLDPVRARRSVRTIAGQMAAFDPENESTYAENAEAYAARLDGLDETFRTRLSERTKGVVLLAGHNAAQYLGHRYDFHVEALTGLAPDAEPSPRDVRRAQSVVEDHDVEYVLAPVFESTRAAERLVEQTDAREVLPLTAVPTLSEAWNDRGWDYVDVMENVNLDSLAKALGAE